MRTLKKLHCRMYSSSRSGFRPHPLQDFDPIPRRIAAHPDPHRFTQQVDSPEKRTPAGRPHIVLKVRRVVPENRKEEDFTIFHVPVDTGLTASMLRTHRGKERLQRLIKLMELFRFYSNFDSEIHCMFLFWFAVFMTATS